MLFAYYKLYWNCSQPTGSTAALMSCTGVQLKVITWWRGLRGCIVRPRWQLIKQVMYTEYVSSWYVANRTTSAYTEFSFRQSILCSLLCSLFWFHIHSYIVPPRGKALSGLLTYVICSSLSWKKHTHLHFFFLRSSPLRPLRQRLICYIYITILISFDFAHLRLSKCGYLAAIWSCYGCVLQLLQGLNSSYRHGNFGGGVSVITMPTQSFWWHLNLSF